MTERPSLQISRLSPEARAVLKQAFAPRQRGRARGRTKERGMNKGEKAYSLVLEAEKASGVIQGWWFEAIKLRLADNTFYEPDFLVLMADGLMEIREYKGHWEDDARVKIKVAAEIYPFRFVAVKKDKNIFSFEYFD